MPTEHPLPDLQEVAAIGMTSRMVTTYSQFKITGGEIPEYGGAGFAYLICTRCGEEVLELDSTRRNQLTLLRGWGGVFGLDQLIEIAEQHQCKTVSAGS